MNRKERENLRNRVSRTGPYALDYDNPKPVFEHQGEACVIIKGLLDELDASDRTPEPFDEATLAEVRRLSKKRRGLRGMDEKFAPNLRPLSERPTPVMCEEPLPDGLSLVAAAVHGDASVLAKRKREAEARERLRQRMARWVPPLRFILRAMAFVRGIRATMRKAWEATATIDGIFVRPEPKRAPILGERAIHAREADDST